MKQQLIIPIGFASLFFLSSFACAADPASYNAITNSCPAYETGFIGECGDLSHHNVSFKIDGASLLGLKLGPKVTIIEPTISSADLRGLQMNGASWIIESLTNVDLRGAEIKNATFKKSYIEVPVPVGPGASSFTPVKAYQTYLDNVSFDERTVFPKGMDPFYTNGLVFKPSPSFNIAKPSARRDYIYSKKAWQHDFLWNQLDADEKEESRDEMTLSWQIDTTEHWDGKIYAAPSFQSKMTLVKKDFFDYPRGFIRKKIVNGQPWFFFHDTHGTDHGWWIPGYDPKTGQPQVSSYFGGC